MFAITERATDAFGPVTYTGEADSVATGFTISGNEFSIDENGYITPLTDLEYDAAQRLIRQVSVTDQNGTSTSTDITINIYSMDEVLKTFRAKTDTIFQGTFGFSLAFKSPVDLSVLSAVRIWIFRPDGTDIYYDFNPSEFNQVSEGKDLIYRVRDNDLTVSGAVFFSIVRARTGYRFIPGPLGRRCQIQKNQRALGK